MATILDNIAKAKMNKSQWDELAFARVLRWENTTSPQKEAKVNGSRKPTLRVEMEARPLRMEMEASDRLIVESTIGEKIGSSTPLAFNTRARTQPIPINEELANYGQRNWCTNGILSPHDKSIVLGDIRKTV